MIAVAQWLRIWVFSIEIPVRMFTLPCNSIAVNAISFKSQKI